MKKIKEITKGKAKSMYTTEIDDAYSLQVLNKDTVKWRVGIHIALLTKFLTPAQSEELGISETSPFFADAYKSAQAIAMDKFLSYNP